MTPRIAKTATIGAAAVALAVVLLAYSAMATPASAQTATTTSTNSQTTGYNSPTTSCSHPQPDFGASSQWSGPLFGHHTEQGGWLGQHPTPVNLTVGQTITISSTSGEYTTTGSSSTNGTASGTLAFTVTGKLSQGYTLSISAGSLTIAGTTYTISSGSAQLDPTGTVISGQGTTTPAGDFILFALAHGTFIGSTGSVSLDFAHGSTEYLVTLSGTVQG